MDGRDPLLVAGIGASAGGIEALRAFFSHTPADTGIAYVVILHLSPEFESRLAEVLQVTTTMPVTQVSASVRLAPDHVYVISPNQILEVSDGTLIVSEMGKGERRAPVDKFFRTLAEGYRTASAAIVLSGTGPNGSNGLKRVKEFGGLTIAQDPAEAAFTDMPNNAIATGLVDHILPVAAMPARIIDYTTRIVRAHPISDPASADLDILDDPSSNQHARLTQEWRDVLTLLRTHTGQDFSNYKTGTIRRRVERRLNVRGVGTLAEYADLLRRDSTEPLLLMKELLISVTNFFRDPEAFEVLEKRVIPQLFDHKGIGDQVRVWSAGCATGEEADPIAMLLAEHAATLPEPPAVQVFATDLDEDAIAVAREGLYSDVDVADIPPARLQRFFQREPAGYHVRRELRELVLFAHHNAIKDPPFSRLDLVVCRNLLIYLNRLIQDRLIETFHFALRPGGFLYLGASEAADATAALFTTVDKTVHIFENRIITTRPPLPVSSDRQLPSVPPIHRLPDARPPSDRILPGELHLRLLEQYAPPSLVVNEEHTLLHASRQAGEYLQMAGGEPSQDVLKLIHPDLRADLRTALHLGAQERSTIEVKGARVDLGGQPRLVRIVVKPVLRDDAGPLRGYFLVLFEPDTADLEPTPLADAAAVQLTSPAEPESRQLSDELAHVKGQLRTTVEQYETNAEEARAANEELQAMNEELRSSAEELETSREELQSVNEELTTVNQELKIKIDELGASNNDLQNLINSTDIGTIFLDRSLRVKLSTPRARDIFNLLPADIGRMLSDITTRVVDHSMHQDIAQVLERLQTIEREVQTREGRWYLMRILPYRTTDDRIDGVAITFHDITARHVAEEQVRAGEERLRLLIDSLVDYAIFTLTPAGVVDSWNSGAQRLFGYTADEIVGKDDAILFTPEDREAGVPQQELAIAARKDRAAGERWRLRKDGTRFFSSSLTTRIVGAEGFATIARDLTERHDSEVALGQARSEIEERVQTRTSELQSEVERGEASRAGISSLLRSIVAAQEADRARIARDLHDQLGQQLTALRLGLEQHRDGCTTDEARANVERALALTQTIDHEIDFLAWELRPATLDDLGLVAALPRFVREWSTHYGVEAVFHGPSTLDHHLSPAAETAFYRVTQEALNNVVKHAHASRVDVILEKRDDTVVLVVEDDGVGFDPGVRDTAEKGIGLAGMRERAALINATLQVESAPGKGTSIFLQCGIGNSGSGRHQ